MEAYLKTLNQVKTIKALFLLKALIWFLFAIIHMVQFRSQTSELLAALLSFDALIFFCLSGSINSGKKWVYYFAVAFVAMNIVLTIFDQFGFFDFLVLIFDGILFAMLVKNKNKLLE